MHRTPLCSEKITRTRPPPLIVQRKISVDRRDHIRICPLAGQKLNYHHSELAVQSKEKAVVFGTSVKMNCTRLRKRALQEIVTFVEQQL